MQSYTTEMGYPICYYRYVKRYAKLSALDFFRMKGIQHNMERCQSGRPLVPASGSAHPTLCEAKNGDITEMGHSKKKYA